MLRGAQKQMIVIRTRNSRVFEEAYFVVRRGQSAPPACKEDMLWEANRIIECSLAAAPQAGNGSAGTHPAAGSPGSPPAGTSVCDRDDPSDQDADDRPPFLSRKGWLRALWFTLGGLCGGGTVGLLWLLL